MAWFRLAALALVAISLGACASISSRYGNDKVDQRGQAYYLPKGVIEVKVVETDGQFDITIAGPIMVADPQFRLHADLRKAAFSDNDLQIKVDPQSQLLTSANVKSIGRGREIIENLTRAAPASSYSSVEGGVPVTVFVGLYEPSQLVIAGEEASAALVTYFERLCGAPAQYAPYNPKCDRFRDAGINQPNMIQLTAETATGASTSNTDLGKCRRGLCYRPLVPVKIRSVIAGTYISEDYYMVPDTSTVSYYTLPSGVFATQEYNLTFDKGVLIEVDQSTQSEVLGFSLLPTKVLKAIIAAPIDAIRGNGGGDGEGNVQVQRSYSSDGSLPRAYQSSTTPLGERVTNTPAVSEPYIQQQAPYPPASQPQPQSTQTYEPYDPEPSVEAIEQTEPPANGTPAPSTPRP